jgi:outer membrane protein TolC
MSNPSKSLTAWKLFALSLLSALTLAHPAFANEVFQNLSLNQAIELGLKNNIEKQISYQSALIAESQYQQALSARWPTVNLQVGFQHRDRPPTFTNPEMNIALPQQLSAGLYGVSNGQINVTSITVPEQTIKMFNQNTSTASLQLLYPLYTGGKISSIINQAGIGKEIAQEEMRRSTLQVVRDVKRYYYAAHLTNELSKTAKRIHGELSNTRDLTKSLYEGGSGTVNKLDYLKTEMAVSYAKSVEIDFAGKHKSAVAALANTMGLSWDSQITVETPLKTEGVHTAQLASLVQQATQFNPQIGVLKLAVRASDEKINEARSGYFPQIALSADTTHYENGYDKGLANGNNKNSWTIGIGLSMPLFNGFLTDHQVSAAKLQSSQMQNKQKLVEQGVATLVKNLLIEYETAHQQIDVSEQASRLADDHSDLTTRAFQIGASKPEDMVHASILQAITQGNLLRARHDQQLNLAELDYVLGSEAQ